MNASLGTDHLTVLANCTDATVCGNASVGGQSMQDFCGQKQLYSRSTASIAVAMSHIVLIPLCLVGNGLVVIAFIMNKRIRTSTNVFVVGLAVSDLLVGVFAVPFWMYMSSYDSMANGVCLEPGYTIYLGLDIFSGCASILQLTAISLERYLCISSPMRHRKLQRYVYYIMVALAWLYAILMAGLLPMKAKSLKMYTLLLFVTCFTCPLLIITTAYAYVFKVGHYQARERKSSTKSIGSMGGSIKEINLAFTVVVLTGLFVVSWLPFFVVNLLAAFCFPCLPQKPWQVGILIRFVKWMQYANCCTNPYVYAYRHVEMKRSFIIIFMKCCGQKPVFLARTRTASILSQNGDISKYPQRRGNSFSKGDPLNKRGTFRRAESCSSFRSRESSSMRKLSDGSHRKDDPRRKLIRANSVLTRGVEDYKASLKQDWKCDNSNVQRDSSNFRSSRSGEEKINRNYLQVPTENRDRCSSLRASSASSCGDSDRQENGKKRERKCTTPAGDGVKTKNPKANSRKSQRKRKVNIIYL